MVWLTSSLLLAFEYFSINYHPSTSVLLAMKHMGWLDESFLVTTYPGRPISLWLGWIGLGLMVAMNVYSLRKRMSWMRHLSRLSDWLNFHIFCGLLGPTFILFHCDFKVRGVVAISFWSMIVSFSSGVIGRYFLVQLLTQKRELDSAAEKVLGKFETLLARHKIVIKPEERERYMESAMRLVGAPQAGSSNALSAMFGAIAGDLRMFVATVPIAPGWPPKSANYLLAYAVAKRKAATIKPFQSLVGYWHAFHFPFAIFMYVAAVIHVIAALVFGI